MPAFQKAWKDGALVEDMFGPQPFTLHGSVGRSGADNFRLDVAKVETFLGDAGYYKPMTSDGPSGWHNSNLDEAIRTFQKDKGLEVDGFLKPNGPTIGKIGGLLGGGNAQTQEAGKPAQIPPAQPKPAPAETPDDDGWDPHGGCFGTGGWKPGYPKLKPGKPADPFPNHTINQDGVDANQGYAEMLVRDSDPSQTARMLKTTIDECGDQGRGDVADLLARFQKIDGAKAEGLRRELHKATGEMLPYLSDWLDRLLAEITRKDCYDRHQRIGRDHGHYVANNAMAVLRGIYNRALKQFEDLPPVNPTIAVDRFPQEKRDCAIPAEKLAEWYQGIRKLPSPIRQDFYLFLLYSGMRRQAALTMRWEDVDLDGATLFVPLPKGGKKRAFSLPLSTSMVEILKRRKEQNMIFCGAVNPWVWPAQSGAGHITEPKLAPLDIKKMGMSFIMHALRHTFATCANAAGVGIYDLKLLMNHALSGDVTTVYVGSGEHLRRAQQKVTDYINGWMLPVGETCREGAVTSRVASRESPIWTSADIWSQEGRC